MVELGMIAYIIVALVLVYWCFEKDADLTATKYVGKESLKSALLALMEKDKLNEPSETHSPVNKRIKWIDEAKI
jgi:Zn-dependent protease with chaperone function